MALRIASSPYIHNQRATSHIMMQVMVAALPGIAAQWYFFGYGTLIQILLAVLTGWISEAAVLRLRKQPVWRRPGDHSALLTALLLAVSLPPLAPWWLVVLGTAFAIIIAKQLYGGLGQNPFNPAMTGYVVLLISFPLPMTRWLSPDLLAPMSPGLADSLSMIFTHPVLNALQVSIDGISQATPLDNFKTGLHAGYSAQQLLLQPIYGGILASPGWQWVNLGYLLGGVLLLARGTIRWHIPVSFLLTLTLCATLGWLWNPQTQAPPLLYLFSGATMLGAFFIVTDPVTAATTEKGRLLFGALTGFLVWLIRSFGGYPDGVAFAVLLANITVPLLDYYTQPRIYGQRKE